VSMENIKAIIFDVDGTLANETSWVRLTYDLGASEQEHLRIFTDMRKGLIDYPQAKQLLLSLWQATGRANRSEFQKIFDSWPLNPSAQEVSKYLQANYLLCHISGSMDLYIETVATKLGITYWYANTQLVWDAEENLIDFHYTPDQSAQKLQDLERFLRTTGLHANQCAAVGDSDNDIGLFKKLPFSVAIRNDTYPELEKVATKSISSLTQLKDIF
jgi:HAD superfamily phosphoserine phosphatase-like hydrolase